MPVLTFATHISLGGNREPWTALGIGEGAIGGVRLEFAGGEPGIREVGIAGLTAARPDGLPLVPAADPEPAPPAEHPLGAIAIDHVVALTDDLARTTGALEAAGLPLRRVAHPQAFLPVKTLLLEVVETGAAPSLWGLVIAVADLDAAKASLGDLLGRPRDAVQPGRRIAGVRRAAGLGTAVALMSARY
jgi:hypothetical protein